MDNKEAIEVLQQDIPCEGDADLIEAMHMAIAALEQQEKAFDEWCHDCKEYDKDRHCCPRFSRVIRGAVDEVKQQGWIPVSKKPKSGTDVLLQFEKNMAVGFYSCGDWNVNSGNGFYTGLTASEDQPIAWMPLPEPYQEDKA